ncbi:MAG: MATE family efflux transporter [Gemmatimonadota bacterium]|nr:MATE family efflux transporter [Gemmatimonadota bacterium]
MPSPTRRDHDRDILRLGLPALGALAADPLVSIVDTVFVGRLGVVPLAALGVNVAVFSLAFVLFNVLEYGTTPMVARAGGRGDRQAAGRTVIQALAVAAITGPLAMLILLTFARPIVGMMGATGELVDPAVAYLRIRALAAPAVLVVTAGHGIFRGYLDTRTPLIVTLGLNVVNLVLDPLLIFGFGLGIAGAAIATVVAQWTGALWFLDLLLRRRRQVLGIELALPRLVELMPFLRIGGALALRTFALIGTMTVATAVATRVGTVAVAAHLVATEIWLFLALVVDALAVAGQALVARYRGAGDAAAARAAADRLLTWGLRIGVTLAVLFFLLAPLLPGLFTPDIEVVAAISLVYPFIVFMQPLNAVVFVWDGVFLGAEDFRFLAIQMILSGTAAGVVLLMVLPMGWGLPGVWWGMVTLMLVRGVTLGWRYWRAWPTN